ncbi:Protein ANTAGONIST OF LIKE HETEROCHROMATIN PROTEIN 1 [Frankliniella fusca]|uniref:Protein ANTAGONIST OF LIKE HETEROCHROMATIN PROTEIN 1 n=1 Tax=Frankliniella fusca TaxID=407009 RepID=A0AAE1HZ07_9NEOP|nr:Protein ANTAGONIST OF LIKE HETEROCHROMATIN PROTEIN 1 [Frankliniella fusca]
MDRNNDVYEFVQLLLTLDDFDDEEEVRGRGQGRSYPNCDMQWWRTLEDPYFKQHFRMDRRCFEILTVTVGRHMHETGKIIRKGLPIGDALQYTLWSLANPDTFRSTGVTYGKARGSIHNQYRTIIEVLRELRGHYIKWPSDREMASIARINEERYGYPQVVGCIDGCHIPIQKPLEQEQQYVNRHHQYSLLVQGVCDDRLLFRDVFIGQPGAVGDARMFRRSPLSQIMLRQQNFMDGFHLLGDGAYPLTDKLLIPYKDYGNMTLRQRTHNRILSRCRSSIERAFALLKGKWRRLKYLPSYSLDYQLDHIMACLVLHNFIILEGEDCDGGEFDDHDGERDNGDYVDLMNAAKARGIDKRQYISAMLMLNEE